MSFLHQNHQFEVIKKRIFLVEEPAVPAIGASSEMGEGDGKKALYRNLLKLAGLGDTEDLDDSVFEIDKLKAAKELISAGFELEGLGLVVKKVGKGGNVDGLVQLASGWEDYVAFSTSMQVLRTLGEEKKMSLLEEINPGKPIKFDFEMEEISERSNDIDIISKPKPDEWEVPIPEIDIEEELDTQQPHKRKDRKKADFPDLVDFPNASNEGVVKTREGQNLFTIGLAINNGKKEKTNNTLEKEVLNDEGLVEYYANNLVADLKVIYPLRSETTTEWETAKKRVSKNGIRWIQIEDWTRDSKAPRDKILGRKMTEGIETYMEMAEGEPQNWDEIKELINKSKIRLDLLEKAREEKILIKNLANKLAGVDVVKTDIDSVEKNGNENLVWYEGIGKDLINATRLRDIIRKPEEDIDEFNKTQKEAKDSLKKRISNIEAVIGGSDNRLKIFGAGKILDGTKAEKTRWGSEKAALDFLKEVLRIDKTGTDKLSSTDDLMGNGKRVKLEQKAEIKVAHGERGDDILPFKASFLSEHFSTSLDIPEYDRGLSGLVWYRDIVKDLQAITLDDDNLDTRLKGELTKDEEKIIRDKIHGLRVEAKKRLVDRGVKIPALSTSPDDGDKNDARLRIRAASEYLYKSNVSKEAERMMKSREEAIVFLNGLGISFGRKGSVESLADQPKDWEKRFNEDSILKALKEEVQVSNPDKWSTMMTELSSMETTTRDNKILILTWLADARSSPPTDAEGRALWTKFKNRLASLGLVV